jgi:hypothetical protein
MEIVLKEEKGYWNQRGWTRQEASLETQKWIQHYNVETFGKVVTWRLRKFTGG